MRTSLAVMSVYQPTSRRPIAAAFRATATRAVRLCLRWSIHPDLISYLSIFASLLAGACFALGLRYPLLLIAGPLLCYVRLYFNMLDGMVAIASNKASRRGEILNDLPDRISDALVFAGVALSGACSIHLAYAAAIFALLTAYVGMLGQAVAGHREFGGLMSKPWRMVVLHVGAWLTAALLLQGRTIHYARLTILDWTCLLIIAGCIQTIWLRLSRTLRRLSGEAPKEGVADVTSTRP